MSLYIVRKIINGVFLYYLGAGVILHRSTAALGYFCRVGGTKFIADSEQSRNWGGFGRNETNH